MQKNLNLNLHNSKLGSYPFLFPLIEKILCLKELNKLYDTAPKKELSVTEAINHILQQLKIQLNFEKKDLSFIPKTGPLIVVANHPFGGIEGIILGLLLLQVRADTKILANYLLQKIEPLENLFIGVNPFTKKLDSKNFHGMKKAKHWLEQGGTLGIFPAGTVSHWQFKERMICDSPWHASVIRLAKKTNATILPIYFSGKNSWYFQLLGMLSPFLRTALLPQQFFSKKNQSIKFIIGQSIYLTRLKEFDEENQQLNYLRYRTYLLSKRINPSPLNKNSFCLNNTEETNKEQQISDIENLEKSACLADHGEFQVYLALPAHIPNILREIFRLREITFRTAGAGTGKNLDYDQFDDYYLHLFVWQKKEKRVVGAYRLGLTDQILPKFQKQGLYLSSLYNISDAFFDKIHPAIELGRSFVINDYQRKPVPLMLLWKGILTFSGNNPQYKSIYGLVSISSHYQKLSRDIIIYFLYHHYLDKEIMPYIKPKSPYPFPRKFPKHILKLIECAADLSDLDEIISEIEPDRKGVPILLKQYRKMQASVLNFNLDPFFNCVDCLCMQYIKSLPAKKIQYYTRN